MKLKKIREGIMEPKLHHLLTSHLKYHLWATEEMWKGIRLLSAEQMLLPRGTSFGTLSLTLNHMFGADRLWLERLTGNGNVQLAEFLSPPDADLENQWLNLIREDIRHLSTIGDDGLGQSCIYVNSQNIRFETPIWQVILHIVNHGSGHRGQVNGIVRQAGVTPYNTELVQFYRISC